MIDTKKSLDNNPNENSKPTKRHSTIVEKIGGPFAVFWVVLGAFVSAALGILISVILARYGELHNWSHAIAYSILSYALISFLFSNLILYMMCKKAEEIELRDLKNTKELEIHLQNANNLYEKALEKSEVFKGIVDDVEKIKKACEGQEKHIKAIVDAAEKMSGALITIDEAVRIEHGAEKEVYIISVDPRLEFKEKFYNVVCYNLLRGIRYSYFFPNSDPVKIERAWKQLVSKLKYYRPKNNETKKIDNTLLKQNLRIYVVNRIHIISNIVLIDPNEPEKTKGWVFPIIENENLIVSVGETLIENAIEQASEWISQKDEFQRFPGLVQN